MDQRPPKQKAQRGGSEPVPSAAEGRPPCAGDRPPARWVRRPTAPERRFPRGTRLLLLAACLLTLPFALAAAPVQAHLAAAHRARSQLAEEEQAWAVERERLELLIAAVRQRAQRLRADAQKAAKKRADLAGEVEALSAKQERLRQVEAMLDALAERLEKALGVLAAESLPGLVPPDTAAGVTDPARRFDAAVARLEETEGRLGAATVEIVTGTLGGREVTVRLLRVGGVAAWWTSLDGSRAGAARRDGDVLALTPASSPEVVEAIQKAFAVAEGRAAPDWVVLPAGHLEVTDAPGKPGG